MSILDFQRPDKVYMIESTDFHGNFEFRPLEPGYGLTIGNALRRVLLSSLEGFAITSVKIAGVEHEFSSIKGIVEDVTEIILNLKQIRLKQQIEDDNSEKVHVKFGGNEQLTAGDIGKNLTSFQILNPDLIICNMDKSVELDMELTIEKGRGYIPSEENKKVTLTELNNMDEVPFHMLDSQTQKFKKMEKYAELLAIKNTGINFWRVGDGSNY